MIINTKRKKLLNFPFNRDDKIMVTYDNRTVVGRILSESINRDYITLLDLETNRVGKFYYDFISYIEILEDEFHKYN